MAACLVPRAGSGNPQEMIYPQRHGLTLRRRATLGIGFELFFLQVLESSGGASTACEYVSVIAKNADHLLTLINEILDYSKIESGQLVLEEIDFDLRAVVDDVSDVVSVPAHKKELELIVLIPPAVPTRLVGDPGRLKQIIINLANNAIKFTEQGQVSLQVSPEPADAGQVGLRGCMADTGIGITAEAQAKLFQPYSQAGKHPLTSFVTDQEW